MKGDESMKTRKELKDQVKKTYKGNWPKAISLNIFQVITTIITSWALIVVGQVVYKLIFAHPGTLTGAFSDSSSSGSGGSSGSLVFDIFGTMLAIGVSYSLLDWLRTNQAPNSIFKSIFSVFSKKYFIPVLVLYILQTVFTFLWTLLFIIPGIIKQYSYSQAYFIYKDCEASGRSEDMNYLDYISESRKLMKGHKFELFVLQLSFLGWIILSCVTLGFGFIWLVPYMNGVMAEYYRQLAGDKFTNPQFTQN